MKKIGIITYHHYYNYGTVLQAYALQKAVETMRDCKSEIIDYRSAEEKKLSRSQMFQLRLKRFFVYVKEWKRVYRLKKYELVLNAKRHAFDAFFERELMVSQQAYDSYKELEKNRPVYDVYMTGSDQTWSPKIGLNPAMFLAFAPQNAKKVAYAPSIGVSTLSEREAKVISKYLASYQYVSCRESRGVELLKKCYPGEVQVVLDPTFLLTADDWNKIAVAPSFHRPYILCYFIGDKKYYRNYAKALSVKSGLPLVYIPVSWVDMEKGNLFQSEAGPKEFLGLIRDATFVLTDSFHGTALSINYHKDFYSFLKVDGGEPAMDNSRITELLNRFSLNERLKLPADEVIMDKIDYDVVDGVLKNEREQSWAYLKEILK